AAKPAPAAASAAAVRPPPAPPASAAKPAASGAAAAPAANVEQPAATRSGAPNRMGPAVRKVVEEDELDPASIAGSAREGRITKGDVLNYIADHQATTIGLDQEVRGRPDVGEPRPSGLARAEQRVAMTRLRARIAERLVQAQQTAAMLTTF